MAYTHGSIIFVAIWTPIPMVLAAVTIDCRWYHLWKLYALACVDAREGGSEKNQCHTF
jgi:hypothetical protein